MSITLEIGKHLNDQITNDKKDTYWSTRRCTGKDWSSPNTTNNNGMNSGDPEELAVPALSLN
jgi:hypothetical protein